MNILILGIASVRIHALLNIRKDPLFSQDLYPECIRWCRTRQWTPFEVFASVKAVRTSFPCGFSDV